MTKEEQLRDLNFIESVFRRKQNEISSIKSNNLSLFYGLIFGIFGNLVVTAFFQYNKNGKYFWLLLISIVILLILMLIFLFDGKRLDGTENELNKILYEVTADRDRIEGGAKFENKHLFKKYRNIDLLKEKLNIE